MLAASYRQLGGNRELAEDVAQETFIRLARARPFDRLHDEPSLRAYLWRITDNLVRDYRRSLHHRSLKDNLDDREEDVVHPFSQIQQNVEIREWLAKSFKDLLPKDRAILRMIGRGDDLRDVAEATGLTYANAAVRLHRLRNRLRKSLVQR